METEEFKYEHGVLMVANRTCHSVIREIAELSMSALGLDAGDFRKRDAVISATNDIFQRALQYQAAQPAVDDALAQSTQSPVEQPPQTVAGELLAALQAMLVTFQYCIDNADLESVEQLVGKQARHAIEAATRHEGA